MAKRKFFKMHGLGNDYIYFDCLEEGLPDPEAVSRRLSDRHFGIGGDGIVLIEPSQSADYRMRMFNADGSEAEMCGNAIRCVGKYLFDRGVTEKKVLSIETGAGLLGLWLNVAGARVESVRVDMGEPILEGAKIPVASAAPRVVNEPFEVDGQLLRITCVSMGNPHAVVFVDEITDDLVFGTGPLLERHEFFPNRVNAEFAKIESRREITMRVWERGSGETMACGTGACAVGVAAMLNDLTERKVLVQLVGGDLEIEWGEDNHVYMTGPATFVFEGEVEI
jgi:diaminopimelate epimerase